MSYLGGSQLGYRVYEELNSNGTLRTLWTFLGIIRTLWTFFRNYTYRNFCTFGGVVLVKISEILVHLGENFGLLRTFLNFLRNFTEKFGNFSTLR